MSITDCLTSAKLEVDKALLLLDLLVQEYPPDEESGEWDDKQMAIFIDYVQGSTCEIKKHIAQAIELSS